MAQRPIDTGNLRPDIPNEGDHFVTRVEDPIFDNDAATKNYVDTHAVAPAWLADVPGLAALAGPGSSTAVGSGASATAVGAVAVGNNAIAGQINATAIGESALVNVGDGTAVGHGAQANNTKATAVGSGATAELEATTVGQGASCGDNGVAIGKGASAIATSIAIGRGAVAASAATAILGSAATPVNTFLTQGAAGLSPISATTVVPVLDDTGLFICLNSGAIVQRQVLSHPLTAPEAAAIGLVAGNRILYTLN